jgi:protein-disulfide isomerase/uncharacterized membrane protein
MSSEKSTKRLLALAILLSLVGLAISLVLTRNYYLHVLAGRVSECTITSYIDCDRVTDSRFSTLAGVPNALISTGYGLVMAALLALGLFAGDRAVRSAARAGALVLAFAGALVSLALAAISAFVIQALCLYCALLQLTNLTIAILLRTALRESWWNHLRALWPVRLRDMLMAASYLVFVVLAMTGLALGMSAVGSQAGSSSAEPASGAVLLETFYEQRVNEFDTSDSPGLGDEGSSVEVVVFSDFTCPHCRDFDSMLRNLALEAGVRLVFKFFPLEGECNPHLPEDAGGTSCEAAAAAYEAYRQGKFWEYSALLFEDFREHSDEQLRAHGVAVGAARPDAIVVASRDEQVYRRLARDVEEGVAAGVEGTPTVFVNGRMLDTRRLRPGDSRYGILRATLKELARG